MLVVVTMNANNGEDICSVHVNQEGDGSGRTHSTVERTVWQRACRFAAEIRYTATKTIGLFVRTRTVCSMMLRQSLIVSKLSLHFVYALF